MSITVIRLRYYTAAVTECICNDPNGNMQSLRRTDQSGQVTDNFSYQYTPGTNRLSAVHGGGSPTGATVFSYEYDALGQMTHEHEGAKDRYLKYDVTGKVIGVYRSAASNSALVRYTYDDKGFRSAKIDSDDNGDVTNTTTYVRDVAGNVLSVYESNYANHYTPTRIEVPLYGAGRVGVLTHLDDGTTTGTDEARYEFNDHLGDARVVFHRPTTTAVTRNLELTQTQDNTAFSREDLYRVGYSPAHSGSYVVRLDGRAAPAPMTRTLSLLRGDTVTFSAWGRIPAGFGGGIYTPARTAQLVPLLLLGAAASPPNLAVSDGLQAGGSNATSRLLSGMAAGIGIVFGGHPAPALIGGGTPYSPSQAWVKYRMEYEDGTVDEQQAFVPLSAANSWQLVGVALRAQQAGTLTLSVGTAETSGFTLFDDLQVEQTNGMIVQEQHQYAYGSPLVGLNYAVGNKRYRYGYQGQYAEKDAETGFESFELRLYNSRIGRWTSYDPEGQFSSPYVGMGNNPVSGTDPDGGWMFSPAGALFGAAAGAVVGGVISQGNGGSFWKGAAFGALIGGAVGGVVGGIGDNAGDIQPANTGHGWNQLRRNMDIEGRGSGYTYIRGGSSTSFSGYLSKTVSYSFSGRNVVPGALNSFTLSFGRSKYARELSFNKANVRRPMDVFREGNFMGSQQKFMNSPPAYGARNKSFQARIFSVPDGILNQQVIIPLSPNPSAAGVVNGGQLGNVNVNGSAPKITIRVLVHRMPYSEIDRSWRRE